MSRLSMDQIDKQYLAEFLDSAELQSILENPLPTMLWSPETHQNVSGWVRDIDRIRRRTAESKSTARSRGKAEGARQKRAAGSTAFKLRQTLEHGAELADLSREVWSQALVKKDGQSTVVPLSPRDEQVISKTNCKSLINLEPVRTARPGVLQAAVDSLALAFNSFTRVPKSQRHG